MINSVLEQDIDEKKLKFVVYVMEYIRFQQSIQTAELYLFFLKHGILNMLIEHYEVLHTQSLQYVCEDIISLWGDKIDTISRK